MVPSFSWMKLNWVKFFRCKKLLISNIISRSHKLCKFTGSSFRTIFIMKIKPSIYSRPRRNTKRKVQCMVRKWVDVIICLFHEKIILLKGKWVKNKRVLCMVGCNWVRKFHVSHIIKAFQDKFLFANTGSLNWTKFAALN